MLDSFELQTIKLEDKKYQKSKFWKPFCLIYQPKQNVNFKWFSSILQFELNYIYLRIIYILNIFIEQCLTINVFICWF